MKKKNKNDDEKAVAKPRPSGGKWELKATYYSFFFLLGKKKKNIYINIYMPQRHGQATWRPASCSLQWRPAGHLRCPEYKPSLKEAPFSCWWVCLCTGTACLMARKCASQIWWCFLVWFGFYKVKARPPPARRFWLTLSGWSGTATPVPFRVCL